MKNIKIEKLSKKDLEFLKWKKKDILEIPQLYKQSLEEELKKIKSIKKEDRTFQNTVLALDYAGQNFSEKIYQVNLLFNLSGNAEIRNAAFEAEMKISDISTALFLDKKLYEALLEYKSKKEKLNKIDQKLLNESIKTFKDAGFDLDPQKQKEVKKLTQKITKLSSKFMKNVNDYQDYVILPKDQTAGLSENYLNTLKKDKKGNYIVTLSYADFGTFVFKSENEELRKKLLEKNAKKGGRQNLKILNQILDLKKQKAKILGHKNHAEHALANKMAKKPEIVNKFLDDIYKKVKKGALKDEKELLDYKISKTGNKKDKLYFYDASFYADQLQKEKYNIDAEEIRQYFVLDDVLKNMFDLFGKLFDFKVVEKKTKLWHKDAKMFALQRNKKDIAYLVLDLFPREGKYGHACMTNWKDAGLSYDAKTFKLPITVLICNFRKPTKKLPSLLSLGEVETIFHEFGHALHNSLTKAKYPSFVGTNVKWDFVETPSQLLENWLKEEKVLRKITKHYQTGKRMPQKMIQNILNADKFQKASFYANQLCYGIIDMILHTKGHKNPEKLFLKLKKEISSVKPTKESLFPASFGHIVGGYDAGYYSYLWAEVFSDDIYSEFKKEGIFSKKVGKRYLKEILEQGSEREETESIKEFLKRKPNNKAFLKKLK
ncbi:hypothetical protein CSB11_01830 [Candidatus Campbellbacteria bacterium]|nr:MAG: hypothetical protein CSB11_01830 [Candidatus Campbellbacteria bacterium]